MKTIMSTLKDRVMEAVTAAKAKGHDIPSIAKRCGISVQAVHAWANPLTPLKGLKGDSLSGLSFLSGVSPWYINDGVGEKVLTNVARQPEAIYSPHQSMLDDLSELPPEDVEIIKQEIRLAAMKARKKKQEKSDRELAAKALDPPLEGRRTCN